MGIVAPFSLVGNPAIKYGDTVTHSIGFAYFGNPMGPRTPNVLPEDIMMNSTDPTVNMMMLQQMDTMTSLNF